MAIMQPLRTSEKRQRSDEIFSSACCRSSIRASFHLVNESCEFIIAALTVGYSFLNFRHDPTWERHLCCTSLLSLSVFSSYLSGAAGERLFKTHHDRHQQSGPEQEPALCDGRRQNIRHRDTRWKLP